MRLVGIPLETARLIKNKYLVKKKLYENEVCKFVQFFEITNKKGENFNNNFTISTCRYDELDGVGLIQIIKSNKSK